MRRKISLADVDLSVLIPARNAASRDGVEDCCSSNQTVDISDFADMFTIQVYF